MDIKDTLFELSREDAVGNITNASDIAYEMLSKYCQTKRQSNLNIIGFLKGKADYTLMLDAHIDQIAMVVTNVDDGGFLTVSNAGGIDIRALPSRRVTIHGKEKVTGVFCSTPMHLEAKEKEFDDIAQIKIDTLLGDTAKEIISVGDFVTFCSDEPFELLENKVASSSFDDRAGVACLIELAKRLHKEELPFNVAFVLSDAEELGLRGTRTATFEVSPNEAIVLDVSFGDGIGISEEESGKLGKGAMIGMSPVLDSKISQKLINIGEQKNIPYQIEVMGERTGTNADMISVNKCGVKTATVSIPLRNMHTQFEILNIDDLNSVCDLLCEYILAGGVMNV